MYTEHGIWRSGGKGFTLDSQGCEGCFGNDEVHYNEFQVKLWKEGLGRVLVE